MSAAQELPPGTTRPAVLGHGTVQLTSHEIDERNAQQLHTAVTAGFQHTPKPQNADQQSAIGSGNTYTSTDGTEYPYYGA